MNSQPFLGIDYGTCNSSMAWFNPKTGQAEILRNAEGEEKTPSVVWFGPKEVLVGKYAEGRLENTEDRRHVIVAAKRALAQQSVLMFDGDGRAITPVDVAAEVLKKLKRDAEALHFYKPVSRAVITHPAVFDEIEKDKLRGAAAKAGFQEIELLAEPVAAALAYAVAGVEVGRHVLVYDLGGGTFDLALLVRDEGEGDFRLAMEPRGARLGGEDFDQAIYDFFDGQNKTKFGKPLCSDGRDLQLLRQCRKYKENLSLNELPVPFSWLMPGMGRLKLQMKRTLFERLIDKQVERTVQLTRSLWEDAVLSRQQTESLILIGGSSRVPLIQRRLREALTVEPRRWEKQDLAVTLGAAYHAQARWGKGQSLKTVETFAPSESQEKQSNVPGESPSGNTRRNRQGDFRQCNDPGTPPMSLDEVKKRFVEEVKLRAYDDKYIDSYTSKPSKPSQEKTAPCKPLPVSTEPHVTSPKPGENNPTAIHPFKAFLIFMAIFVIAGIVYFPALAIVKPGLIALYWINWIRWSKQRQ